MLHFMKEGIFMNQEIIKVILLEEDESDILRFRMEEEIDINLNSPECQASLKRLFTLMLEEALYRKVVIELEIQDGYSRGMYIEVCQEYIKDLNRELREITEIIQKEIDE